MMTLNVVADKISRLKIRFADMAQEAHTVKRYGIKPCINYSINSCNDIKLQLIFLTNLGYFCLSDEKLLKIKSGNYPDLETFCSDSSSYLICTSLALFLFPYHLIKARSTVLSVVQKYCKVN